VAKKNAELSNPKARLEQKSGNPGKSPHHEGPAGAGPVTRNKFNKDDRDPVGQKEPQKSRGPGG
jgi:hypothetical protein